MTHILEVNNISHRFSKRIVLEDISFLMHTGDILGLLGRNGSGKSTLLKILSGDIKASSGKISINKHHYPIKEIYKGLVAFCPQQTFVPKDINVRSIIPLYFPEEEQQSKLFYAPGINQMELKKVGELSIGQQKYLQFLLVANLHHHFLLFDEPFAMVEPLYKDIIKEKLLSLRKEKNIIITDHYYQDVLDVSTQKLLIKNGVSQVINNEAELIDAGYLPNRENLP